MLFAFLCSVALVSQAATPKVPPTAELKTLARDSLLQFNDAIQAKDFTGFHKKISALWQSQITPEQLLEVFHSFIDQHVNIAAIATVEPVFEPAPKIDGDGVLVVEGRYETPPKNVDFRLKYVQEKDAWKLIGVRLNVTPAVPSEAEAKTLVRDSLLAFNDAVQAKDFTSFHKKIATLWQEQITPEKLQELFQSFIDQKINLAPIAKLQAKFAHPPSLDDDGLLNLDGSYDLEKGTLRFNLAYIFEATGWRLAKINVKVGDPGEE